MKTRPAEPCPCARPDDKGRPLAYPKCCGQYLDGAAAAPDAESLMRSRYTAYVRGDEAYLLATWHASTRPARAQPEGAAKWLGLEVRDRRELDADHAEVEFVARVRPASGPAVRLHERSRFVRQDGHWFYVAGDML